jgi:hypothetical protein
MHQIVAVVPETRFIEKKNKKLPSSKC